MRKFSLVSLAIAAGLSIATLYAQTIVDATGPVRQTHRKPMPVHGSGAARQLAVDIDIRLANHIFPGKPAEVMFRITNQSKHELVLPISPHEGDFDSAKDSHDPVLQLGLRISSTSKGQAGSLLGGTDLFGEATRPSSILRLSPGQSFMVRCKVGVPHLSNDKNAPDVSLLATANLDELSVRTASGKPFLDSVEIGRAQSQEYSLRTLIKQAGQNDVDR
jgi:hypothetical protein